MECLNCDIKHKDWKRYRENKKNDASDGIAIKQVLMLLEYFEISHQNLIARKPSTIAHEMGSMVVIM